MIKKLLHYSLLACLALLFCATGLSHARTRGEAAGQATIPGVALASLPPQAQQTMRLIRGGGPYPYRQDGAVFGNYERLLPSRPRGYYREFTVRTPSSRDRGASRIIAGGSPAPFREYFYTDDHYASFKHIDE